MFKDKQFDLDHCPKNQLGASTPYGQQLHQVCQLQDKGFKDIDQETFIFYKDQQLDLDLRPCDMQIN